MLHNTSPTLMWIRLFCLCGWCSALLLHLNFLLDLKASTYLLDGLLLFQDSLGLSIPFRLTSLLACLPASPPTVELRSKLCCAQFQFFGPFPAHSSFSAYVLSAFSRARHLFSSVVEFLHCLPCAHLFLRASTARGREELQPNYKQLLVELLHCLACALWQLEGKNNFSQASPEALHTRACYLNRADVPATSTVLASIAWQVWRESILARQSTLLPRGANYSRYTTVLLTVSAASSGQSRLWAPTGRLTNVHSYLTWILTTAEGRPERMHSHLMPTGEFSNKLPWLSGSTWPRVLSKPSPPVKWSFRPVLL